MIRPADPCGLEPSGIPLPPSPANPPMQVPNPPPTTPNTPDFPTVLPLSKPAIEPEITITRPSASSSLHRKPLPIPTQQLPLPIEATGALPMPQLLEKNQKPSVKAKKTAQKIIRRTRTRVLNKTVLSVVVGRELAPTVASMLKNGGLDVEDGVAIVGTAAGAVGGATPVMAATRAMPVPANGV